MIFDFQLLFKAWRAESKGKGDANNQQRYRYSLEENLYALANKLNTKQYRPAPLRLKQILYPKRRQAQVPSQEDKIVQHAICDEHAYYPLVASLVKEASANTRGRGTDYGRMVLKQQLRSFWTANKQPPCILKADIHSFFYSIPHDRAFAIVNRYIHDEEIKAVLKSFIRLTGRGLPLGLQQSQLIANLYLSELDHKLKERWHVRYYGRHMDDFYVLSNSREALERIVEWLREYTADIGLELNPKTCILYRSFDYLGFSYTVSDTGKIIERLSKNKLKSKRRYLQKLAKQLQTGEITNTRAEAAYFGWRVHSVKAKNARTQILNMDKYFKRLLNERGYDLIIRYHPKGKIHFRVEITPLEKEL